MGQIRQKEQKNKIDGKPSISQGCCSEQYPWFSLRSMTSNSRYDLSSLKNGTEREQTLNGLYTKLSELSKRPWTYWMQNQKSIGLETMAYSNLSFSAGSDATISKDTTVYIFRFNTYKGSGKGRIIGYKASHCAVYHIIGYDLDFSAYKHS